MGRPARYARGAGAMNLSTDATDPPLGTDIDVDVLFLEMTTPPARPPVPAPRAGVDIVPMTRPTVGFFRYLYDAVGREWTWFERCLLSDEALAAVIGAPSCALYQLQVDGVPAGFCEITRDLPEGATEITFFGLIGDFIGQGLGWYFLNAAVDLSWATAPAKVILNTCDLDHTRALGNYTRAGFRVVGYQRKHLPDPRLTSVPRPPALADRPPHPVHAAAAAFDGKDGGTG